MKIKLSKYWWANFYLMSILFLIIEGYLFTFLMDTSGEDLIILISIMIMYMLVCSLPVIKSIKFLMVIKIQGDNIQSFLFGRLKCDIDTRKKVYYRVFRCRESMFNIKDYIAISNSTFEYEKGVKSQEYRFIDYYNYKKNIILPWNKETMSIFGIDDWICVN